MVHELSLLCAGLLSESRTSFKGKKTSEPGQRGLAWRSPRPQPRGAADSAGVSVSGSQEAGVDAVREHEARPTCGYSGVKQSHIGDATAQNDGVRIQHIDDGGECACQAIHIAVEGSLRYRIAALGQRSNLNCGDF